MTAEKQCVSCNSTFLATREYFYGQKWSDGLRTSCKSCARSKSDSWRKRNPAKVVEMSRTRYHREKTRLLAERKESRIKMRMEALRVYSNGKVECACCGENRYEFLALDHINGGGKRHRIKLKALGGQQFILALRRNGWPKGIRVLCHNCNMAMGFYGVCPHNRSSCNIQV